ncbi:MAG TPA: carboxymuconolactone decarboxylase family protein [Thermoanaerobaculia bacterium]|nr:carboxymuconolactone decarboxylase family protein [Thermoanaerobaculia bacterium]
MRESSRVAAARGALVALVVVLGLSAGCGRRSAEGEPRSEPSAETAADATMESGTFSPRPTTPRLLPVAEEGRSAAQVAMLASRPDFNIYRTLAHHPELYEQWSGFGRFVLNGSSLPAREREIVMLRMGWLCQSEYEWAQHARIAEESAGMTVEEIRRIAEGPDAPGWSDFERALLRMTDELRYDAKISDATWSALRAQYSEQQVMEALFTAGQYQLVSMALNTLGVQLDPGLEHRLPEGLPLPDVAGRPASDVARGRLPALGPEGWSDEQRALLAPVLREDGTAPNLHATLVHHPQLFAPLGTLFRYLAGESGLPPQDRALLILRTAWNLRAEYLWAHYSGAARAAGLGDEEIARVAAGPDAPGWTAEQAALLRAADELRREAFVSDATWAASAASHDPQRLIEVVFTVGGYSMTALAIRSFGVEVEAGLPGFPEG